MSSLLPVPEPADPVEGQPGHFEHTNWVKRALKALDQGLLRKPAAGVPAGKVLGTTAPDTWGAVDLTAVGGVPAGAIVMWQGSTAPAGWAICNGQNGTPDLRNKFVLGAGTRSVGTQGGVESVTLTGAQSGVPAHTHVATAVDLPHTHSINRSYWRHSHTIYNGGSHVHSLDYSQDVALGGANGKRVTGAGSINNTNTAWGGEHAHGMSEAWATPNDWAPTEMADVRHGHPVAANAAANASQPHDNMPPFYVLVYIIKL